MPKVSPHPGVAAVLSFVYNGLGQLYNGQIKKGLWIIFFSSLGILIFIVGALILGLWLLGKISSAGMALTGFLLLLSGLVDICLIGAFSIYDAYNYAIKQ
ncbi:MAG: hypothetical protein FJZ09_03545 [Candidatus Omnitrophica bacterium]|nr:hypothetical protein [Candidatus Omnitrophota bacterium]